MVMTSCSLKWVTSYMATPVESAGNENCTEVRAGMVVVISVKVRVSSGMVVMVLEVAVEVVEVVDEVVVDEVCVVVVEVTVEVVTEVADVSVVSVLKPQIGHNIGLQAPIRTR